MSALQIWPDEQTTDVGKRLGYARRTNRRQTNRTLCVVTRGRPYQTLNWSLGGMLLDGYDGVLSPGETFEIDAIGLAGGRSWPVMIQARVVRVGGQTGMELAAQFLTLSAPAFDFLEGVLLRRHDAITSAV